MKKRSSFIKSSRYQVLEDLRKDSVDLCLVYCGCEKCAPGHRYGPNKRDSYVLHVVEKGTGTLEIYNRKYQLKRGDAFLIPMGVEAWYEADMEDPWAYIWVGITGLKADDYLRSAGFMEKEPIQKVEKIESLHRCIEEMLKAHQLSQANELKRNGLLMMFLSTLIQEYESKAPSPVKKNMYQSSVYVRHAMEYIWYNYNQKIKISDLADYIGVNRSYLASSFKKMVGCSPQEYLLNFRMEKAKGFLNNTNMQIREVAEAVGYSDQLAFSKMFRMYYGVSPKNFREQGEKLVIKESREDD